MTATAGPPDAGTARRNLMTGRWLDHWEPEDEDFWQRTGRTIANRNLLYSVISEHIGFSVWTLWSVMVLFMGPEYGIDAAGKFFLVAVPTLVGAVLRLPYTFAVAKFGGRNWTIVSAALLLVPTVLAAIVMHPGTSYTTFMVVACFAGLGGGNFASSMTNINAFFPERYKGWALGLNAGGGNIGVPVIQLIALLIIATAGAAYPRLILAIYIPLIVVAARAGRDLHGQHLLGAQRHGRVQGVDPRAPHLDHGVPLHRDVRIVHRLQLRVRAGAAEPVRPHAVAGRVDHVHRPAARFADQAGRREAGRPVRRRPRHVPRTSSGWSSPPRSSSRRPPRNRSRSTRWGSSLLFVLTGVGNGSTYKMIPAIFRGKATAAIARGGDERAQLMRARRISGAAIGIIGAVGALGGVLINMAFRQSFLVAKTGDPAFWAFIAFYVACIAVTYVVYLRPVPVDVSHPRAAYARV